MPCLAIRDIEDKRARDRAAEKGKRSGRKAEGRLVKDHVTTGWKAARGALAIVYLDRINPKIN